jgi:TolB protein
MDKAKRLGKGTTLGFITLMLCGFLSAAAQDRIKIELNMGQERPRLAAPDFKAANGDPQTAPLNTAFNQTLWNDLDNAGIFDMVAKSFYPSQQPGQPAGRSMSRAGSMT